MLAFGRRTLRSIPFLFTAALLAGACSHKIETPPLESSQVQPDLLCNAQIPTPVVITGDDFTPMPSRVLTGKKKLILPTVTLHYAAPLTSGSAGAGTGGAPPRSAQTVDVSGDPSMANARWLSWQSEKQMTLTVGNPGLEIDYAGIYDLTVENPDGTHTADISLVLAVVPPPSIKDIIPPSLCNDQADQKLIVEGENFIEIGDQLPTVTITSDDGKTMIACSQTGSTGDGGSASGGCTIESVGNCADIPGRNPPAQLCGTATAVIKVGTLSPGKYPVVLTNPARANCHSTESITLTVNCP